MALNQILGVTKLKYEYAVVEEGRTRLLEYVGMLLMPMVVKKQQFVGKPDQLFGIASIWSQRPSLKQC